MFMSEGLPKCYLFASAFDQTLTFNTPAVHSASCSVFRPKSASTKPRVAKLNLVQQGAKLAYLLLDDPEFRGTV